MSQKEHIISVLQQKKVQQELLKFGVSHLRLFGSYAKGTNQKDSDIDLLYQYDYSKGYTGRGVVGAYGYLEELLKSKLDFVHIDSIHPLIQDEVLDSKIELF